MSRKYDLPDGSPYSLLSDAQTRAWFAYMKVQLRLNYEMNRQLRTDSSISLADYDVLVALTSEPTGSMRMTQLAIRIGWERTRASHHVRRLHSRGLVTMAPSAADGRATDVTLTDSGWLELRESTPAHVALVRSMFLDVLSTEQLEQLAGMMEQVYEKVIALGTLPPPEDHP
jgi:DNA-binding MarR family transcriptional regulator